MLDERVLKVPVDRENVPEGFPHYPYSVMRSLPDCVCAFDSFRGTVGIDVFPFAVTTRVSASNQVFVKVYEEE